MLKRISGPVGKGGKNRPEDVIVVQYLLNCVPAKQGGPKKELILDGLCGPLTNEAIVGFQRKAMDTCDGKVSPGGPTFSSLLGYDPYPTQKLTLPSGTGNGKRGGTPSTNSWDPWGYLNPGGSNYRVDGKEPGGKFGGGEYSAWKVAQRTGQAPGKQGFDPGSLPLNFPFPTSGKGGTSGSKTGAKQQWGGPGSNSGIKQQGGGVGGGVAGKSGGYGGGADNSGGIGGGVGKSGGGPAGKQGTAGAVGGAGGGAAGSGQGGAGGAGGAQAGGFAGKGPQSVPGVGPIGYAIVFGKF